MNYNISHYVLNYCRPKLFLYVIFKVQFNMKFLILIFNPNVYVKCYYTLNFNL